MTDRYQVWLQPDPNKTTFDPGTLTAVLNLDYEQHEGVVKAMMALTRSVNTVIETYFGRKKQRPQRPNMGGLTVYEMYLDVNTLDIPNLYNRAKYIISGERRENPRMWALFRDPYPKLDNPRAGFIIPFETNEELQGILSVFRWLGLNPRNYLVKIQDNAGNEYTYTD